jgi:AbrB family looped-hinge helix DNA binding protein
MRVTSKGQVTIPQDVRERLGILPGTEVDFIVRGGYARLVKAKQKRGVQTRGQRMVAHALGKGSANRDLTTEQIMAITRGWGEDDFDR